MWIKKKKPAHYSEEEKQYLQTQGIIPPEAPPMPDPVKIPPPPGMDVHFEPNISNYYQSMNSNYQTVALDTTEKKKYHNILEKGGEEKKKKK